MLCRSWTERLKEAESLKAAELQYLKRCGVAIGLQCDKKIPCLVNLAADPMLTGTLLYLLPPGRMVIGRSVDSSDSKAEKPDIGLNGPLIQPHHWYEFVILLIYACTKFLLFLRFSVSVKF